MPHSSATGTPLSMTVCCLWAGAVAPLNGGAPGSQFFSAFLPPPFLLTVSPSHRHRSLASTWFAAPSPVSLCNSHISTPGNIESTGIRRWRLWKMMYPPLHAFSIFISHIVRYHLYLITILIWYSWTHPLFKDEAPSFLFITTLSLVKNLPAMWETWVRSLGWEDPLEKG